MLSDIRGCLQLLTPEARWRWAVLLPLALAVGLLEAMGAGAASGLITLLGDPTRAATLPVASWISGRAGGGGHPRGAGSGPARAGREDPRGGWTCPRTG